MRITIEQNDFAEFPLKEEDCLGYESGTIFKGMSGNVFMVVKDYRRGQHAPCSQMIMFAEGGTFYNGNWQTGYKL